MIGRTHLAVGIATGIATSQILPELTMPVVVAASAFGSLLPDICHTKSKIGRKLPVISMVISTVFGHRTMTHSLFFLLIVPLIIKLLAQSNSLSLGVCIGMASHLILDFMTKSGIGLLWPLSIKIRNIITVKTGGWMDKIMFYGAIAYIIYQTKEYILQFLS